jgi:hypothetical protein
MRPFILFFVKKEGVILLVVLAIIGICYYVGKANREKQAAEAAKQPKRELGRVVQTPNSQDTAPKESELERRNLTPVNHPASPVQPQVNQAVVYHPTLAAFDEEVPVSTPSPTPTPSEREQEAFLPPSIFIPCVLVNTVESSHINTPVVGKVERDVIREIGGVRRVIVPAGTICSSFAQSGAVRDRIEVAGKWLFVFPDGKSLTITGIACNRQADPSTLQFGQEDAGAGLQGSIQESNHWSNAQAFITLLMTATVQTGTAAVSGMTSRFGGGGVGLPDTTPILAKYIDQLWNGETGDGRFVQVLAGSEFYVFPCDTLIPSHRSAVAKSRVDPGNESAPSTVSGDPLRAAQMEKEILRENQPQVSPTPGNPSPNIRY